MSAILDDEQLNGPHAVRISVRPQRVAYPVALGDMAGLTAVIRRESQIWGGAASPIIPVEPDGSVVDVYEERLLGSSIDRLAGLSGFMKRPLRVSLASAKDADQAVPLEYCDSQLAVGLLPYGTQERMSTLEIVELREDDPWRNIYAATLGDLDDSPDMDLLVSGNWVRDLSFESFVHVERRSVNGSLQDLIERASRARAGKTYPRAISMSNIAYGGTASTGIRSRSKVLAGSIDEQIDAGPNLVVICSPNSVEDLALLWNLRGANGDHYGLPIGVPVSETGPEVTRTLLSSPHARSLHGIAARPFYFTSASLSVDEIRDLVGVTGDDRRDPGFLSQSQALNFGRVWGVSRQEVLVWTEGTAHFTPLTHSVEAELRGQGRLTRNTHLQFDLDVLTAPAPLAPDVRADFVGNGSIYGGAWTTWSLYSHNDSMKEARWPSSLLFAKSIAAHRGLKMRESEPGTVARILMESIGDPHEVSMLAHRPLLELLEGMAARQGMSLIKRRARELGLPDADATESVGRSPDELADYSYEKFRTAFGGNSAATKFWLRWAIRHAIVVKGFRIVCPVCKAKQWVPVEHFSPPITCHGCTRHVESPFDAPDQVKFSYKLSERLRRVYEVDAMGHVLVARYFNMLFSWGHRSRIVGTHPGMEFLDGDRTVGEADLLMLTRRGEFIPVEVKRSGSGFVAVEEQKLDKLQNCLSAPWSVVAACQYDDDLSPEFFEHGRLDQDGAHRRIMLSYDELLEGFPVWALADDPFARPPLDRAQIEARERSFAEDLARQAQEPVENDLEWSMLHPAHADEEVSRE